MGTLISIRHFAATPLGLRVRAVAYLRETRGRTLVFDAVAYDELEKIAEGQNEQLMVSAGKFLKRAEQKAAGAKES